MTDLLSTFEEKQMLAAWANDAPPDDQQEHGIQVYIGDESPVESMKDCSVVTATYKIKEGVYGKIGIVGPWIMNGLLEPWKTVCSSWMIYLRRNSEV